MAAVQDNSPNISNHMIEIFARRVYAPVVLGGVGVLSMLITSLVMRVMLSLLCSHAGVPSWAHALTTDLWSAGVWGVLALPFLYVVLISVYGYTQRKEIDLTERRVVRITTLAGLVYGMVYRVALQIMTAVASDTCTACTSSQGAQTHLLVTASAQRETHTRPPRLSVGRSGSAKEAEHVRPSFRSITSSITTAASGGARA